VTFIYILTDRGKVYPCPTGLIKPHGTRLSFESTGIGPIFAKLAKKPFVKLVNGRLVFAKKHFQQVARIVRALRRWNTYRHF